MKRPVAGILGIVLGALVLELSACAAIDAGHEGVLVEQPFFFGHGGVDPVPSKTGRVWLAPTPGLRWFSWIRQPRSRPSVCM